MGENRPWFDGLTRFFDGGGFPTFVLAVLGGYELLLVALLLTPVEPTGMEGFSEAFRVWCFGLDPATGRYEIGWVAGMLVPPFIMTAFILTFWWGPLRDVVASPRTLLRPLVVAASVVALGGTGFASLYTGPDEGEMPFPAEGLRTSFLPPDLVLTDHTGQTLDLAELRGKVVVITAVYASCGQTCPTIMAQVKRAVASVPEDQRDDLRVVGVTLDPGRDTPEVLAALAGAQGVSAPLFSLVTGEPAKVEQILDDLGVARERDPETGVISHANLFVVIDRQGRVAYRFTLGERQERWLISALGMLLREGAGVG